MNPKKLTSWMRTLQYPILLGVQKPTGSGTHAFDAPDPGAFVIVAPCKYVLDNCRHLAKWEEYIETFPEYAPPVPPPYISLEEAVTGTDTTVVAEEKPKAKRTKRPPCTQSET